MIDILDETWDSIINQKSVLLVENAADYKTCNWYNLSPEFFRGLGDLDVNIFPGSFNPFHEGHAEIRDRYKKNTLNKIHYWFYEICIFPICKEPLKKEDILTRLSSFKKDSPVLISNLPLFIEKTGFYKNNHKKIKFHVGYDTIDRMLKQHGEAFINGIDAHFVVYPRSIGETKLGIKDLEEKFKLNRHYSNIILEIDMNNPISSTQIRNGEI